MDLSEGRANPEGTERFVRRSVAGRNIPRSHFRVGPGGINLSSLGLGTYLGAADPETDALVEQAVQICLTSGRVNVLDTAINYRNQRAERSVGRAVRRLLELKTVQRDEFFVSTKIGYLAPDGEAGLPAPEWVRKELLRPGVLRPSEIVDGSHSMSVPFLADQLARSRRNLGVETVDLVYLHNAPDAQLPYVGADEFRRRLEEAFSFLEAEREAHRIAAYGLATWDSLRTPRSDPGYLSLEQAVDVARRQGGKDYGFCYVQFPFNLMMPEAALLRNQSVHGERKTLFEAAQALGLGCFTSVPLLQGQLARGSGIPVDGLTPAQVALQFARSAPGTLAALVGQKQAAHLSENLELSSHPPWDAPTFERYLSFPGESVGRPASGE